MTALAVRVTRQYEQPAEPAGAVIIPPDAIAACELTWSRSTMWDTFQRLQAQGAAWQHPCGTRYFDRRHPQILKRLMDDAGIADQAWNNARPEDQRESQARCRFIEAVQLSASGPASERMSRKEALAAACRNLAGEMLGYSVALPTYYRWYKKYTESGRRRSSLIDQRGRTDSGQVPFDGRAWAYFESIWLTPQRRGIRGCWRQTQAMADKKGWAWPSYTAVCRRVATAWPPQKADFYRLGERLWRMKHEYKLINDTREMPGNHTWVIDNTRLDFWARVGKRRLRLWVSLITDRASNIIAGWAITTNPSSDSLIVALRRAVTRHGAPLEAMLDNGEDMKSGSFGNKNRKWVDEEWAGGVFDQLGVKLHWCRPYSPWAKGQVEAMGRTVHEMHDKLYKSYCGGTTATRPDGIDKWCAENLDKLPTLADVENNFAQFVETFADRPSDADGVKPLTPHQRFEQTRIAKRTLPAHVLNVVLTKLTAPRKVTAKGILYNNLHYIDDGGHTFEHQGKELRLRVDPDDITKAWACDLRGKPLFIVRQNLCKGSADDVRVAMNRRKQDRIKAREGRLAQARAHDDLPMAVMRVQAERFRDEAKRLDPPDGPPAATVAPIMTPAAQAAMESAETISRQEKREQLRQQTESAWPRESIGLTAEDLAALSMTDDDLPVNDEADDLDVMVG